MNYLFNCVKWNAAMNRSVCQMYLQYFPTCLLAVESRDCRVHSLQTVNLRTIHSFHCKIFSSPATTPTIFVTTGQSGTGLNWCYNSYRSVSNFYIPVPDQLGHETLVQNFYCLYPDSENPVIQQLVESKSVEDVLDIISRSSDKSPEEVSQAVVSLWEVLKVADSSDASRFKFTNRLASKTVQKNISDERYEILLDLLAQNFQNLDNSALTSMLLFLPRLNFRRNLSADICKVCLERLESFSLDELSRFSFCLREQKFYNGSYYPFSKVLEIVERKMATINSVSELKYVTYCLINSTGLLTEDLLKRYLVLVDSFLNYNRLSNEDFYVMELILRYFSATQYVEEKAPVQIRLLELALNKLPSELNTDIVKLASYFIDTLEPRLLYHHFIELTKQEEISEMSNVVTLSLILHSWIPVSEKRRQQINDFVVKNLNNFESSYWFLSQAVNHIQKTNPSLCSKYWSRALAIIKLEESADIDFHLSVLKHICFDYMYMFFYRKPGQIHQEVHFEQLLCDFLNRRLTHVCNTPAQMALMSAFIIGYDKNIENVKLVSIRMIDLSCQLSFIDVVVLSLGVAIRKSTCHRNSWQIPDFVFALSSMLDSVSVDLIKEANNFRKVKRLLRGYHNRYGQQMSPLLHQIMEAFHPYLHQLNSRLVFEAALSLMFSRYYAPQIMDAMLNYCVENEPQIPWLVVQKVLTMLYHFNYQGPIGENFCEMATRVLITDESTEAIIPTLSSYLALCQVHRLPSVLIRRIFNVDFLSRFDKEIMAIHSQTNKSSRLARRLLMELNRAICLEYPEEKVPWFHETYCLDTFLNGPSNKSSPIGFNAEVYQILSQIVGGKSYVRQCVWTPYFYFLDFEFALDTEGRSVPVTDYVGDNATAIRRRPTVLKDSSSVKRFSVLLRHECDHSDNNWHHLNGQCQLQQRHLQMLGYNVIEIAHHEWHAMALSTDEERQKHLREKIFPDH